MYKTDQQGKMGILLALALLLIGAILFDWSSAIRLIMIPFILVLLWIVHDFHRRLQKLEQQTQAPVVTSTVISESPAPSSMPTTLDATPVPAWMQQERPSSITPHAADIAPSPVHASHPAWWQPAIDWMMHGNPILRVAVAVLMVGVVLLLRFASEHWQLSLGLKLGFIASAGAATTIAGYLLQRKNQLFAVALQGVGLAVVFLTLIFSHHFAVIASLTTASILFVLLLLVTVALSLKQQALYLAMLALTMAYIAPLVIPQNHPDVIFLFGYYFVINLAVVAVNFIQPWKILHQIAFFATMFIGGAVIGMYAHTEQFATLDWILWLHMALFIWLSVRYSQLMLRAQNNHSDLDQNAQQKALRLQPILDVGLIFSVPVLGFSLHAYLMHNSTQALTWGAVALAGVYIGLNLWIKRQHPQLSVLAKSFFILAVVFIALIFPLAKGAHWTSTGWVIQGAALIVWGVTERYRLSRYIGVALVLLSSVALIIQIWSNDHFPILSTVIYALAQFISAFYLLHYQEVEKYFSARMLSGIFLALGMYAGALAGVEWLQWQSYAMTPYLAIAVVLFGLFNLAVYFKSKLQWANVQLMLVAGLLCLMYGESFAIDLYAQHQWPTMLQQSCFMVAALGLTWILHNIGPQKNYLAIWSTLFWLALASIGLAIFPILPLVGLAFVPMFYQLALLRKDNALLKQIPVICLNLCWLILISLDHYSAEHYYLLPILNYTDAASLLMLAGVIWVIYRHDFGNRQGVEWGLKVTAILTGLLVLSSVMVRAMHHYMGTPLWSLEIWSNGDVQLSLTLLWVVLAFILMAVSSQRHIRQIWFVGAALLAIVVAKLLLLDLSQSGTLTRVISFIGSGMVMLVIAYIAPLPPVAGESREELR